MHIFSVIFLLVSIFCTEALATGDVAAGQAKAAACAGCHGMDGNSISDQFPKLAGQHAAYTAEQLKAYQTGVRNHAIMKGMAAGLSEQDMADLGAYFEAQKTKLSQADPALITLGEKIYRGGNLETGVSACMSCHGPTGAGNGPAGFPQLNGQHATYIVAQLKAYQSGQRGASPKVKMMNDVAKRLSEAEIKAVSSYIQGLR